MDNLTKPNQISFVWFQLLIDLVLQKLTKTEPKPIDIRI